MIRYHYYCYIQVLGHFRPKLCVAIDYCFLSYIERELNLISFTENNYKC